MHVLLVTDRWADDGGGRERYQAELRTALLARGHPVSVLAHEALGERQLRRRVETFRQSNPRASVLSVRPFEGATHYQMHSGVYAAAHAAEREAYDSSLRRLLFEPALLLNARRRRVLGVEARMFAAASGTRVMVFSNRSADELTRLFNVPSDRVTLARPGIDLSVFGPRGHAHADAEGPGRRLRLLFAGHNFALKGLRWAIEALALARRRGTDAELVVAGRGAQRSFGVLARRLGVDARVRFTGAVTQQALSALYRDSDLLVHPTFYDPFPRVIVEAMASGLPVVTTAVCGGAELIVPGENGFVVTDPRGVEALADAIATMSDADRRTRMSIAAADTGRRFDFHTHVDEVEQWLSMA
jgi:UDP-glucose:(heptosyl)LPS alpha-1,3-glucosyltransferase